MVTYDMSEENAGWVVRVKDDYLDIIQAIFSADTFHDAVELCLADIEKYDVMDFEIISPKMEGKKMTYSTQLRRALNGLAFDNDVIKPLELVAARLASTGDNYEHQAANTLLLIIEGLKNNNKGEN